MNPCRIFVVEDEVIVAMELEERLKAMGYRFLGSSGQSELALTLIERQRPDLVLMDIHLKGEMDGISAAGQIRRRFHLPVVFLTAYSGNATLERAMLAEPYGYVIKPFDDRELKSAIEIALHKHRADEQTRHLNGLYDVLSQVNQAMVRTRSWQDAFSLACRLLVERGAVDLAWIAWRHPDTGRIVPVAHFASSGEILVQAQFDTEGPLEGMGNPGKAIEEARPFICNECTGLGCLYPSSCFSPEFGFQSCGSFPLEHQGGVRGAICLCIQDAGFFKNREIELLKEIARDVSRSLERIEGEARRERAGERMQKSEAFFSMIFRENPEPIAITRLSDGRIVDVNTAWSTLTGYSRERAMGHTVPELKIWVDEHSRMFLVAELMKSGSVSDFEAQIQNVSGRVSDLIFSAERIVLDDVAYALVMARDITERKRMEQERTRIERQLQETQKMEAIGRLAGKIAHDFNNILTAVIGFSEMALLKSTEADGIHEDLLQIRSAGFRARDLVKQILTFSRPSGSEPGSVAHAIVKSRGGAITVEETPGEGGTRCDRASRAPEKDAAAFSGFKDAPEGKGRILLVDDEAALTDLGKALLERLGYSVEAMNSGRQAMKALGASPDRFDLLITDYTMPSLTGLDLAREAKRLRPGLPVIVCSGYNEIVNETTAASFDIEGFISKPFNTRQISESLNRILRSK